MLNISKKINPTSRTKPNKGQDSNSPTSKTDWLEIASLRRAKLLDILLRIVGIGLLPLLLITQIDDLVRFEVARPEFIAELVVAIIIIVCYVLNRLKYSYISALLFFGSVGAIILFYLLGLPDHRLLVNIRVVPVLLIVPVVAAGVVIKPIYSFIFSAISLAGLITIGLIRTKPGLYGLETPWETISNLDIAISLLIIMAGIAWFFENNVQSLLKKLAEQNRSLRQLNRELSLKRQMENRLNEQILTFTNEVANAFNNQQENSKRQLSAVNEVSGATMRLDDMGEQITDTVITVNATVDQALNIAESDSLKAKYMVESLNNLQEQAENISQAMSRFSLQTQQINQIAGLIDEIAEQTSLLSLNASIEAAGAGENGQRFRAIAKEVQRLSERSQQASGEVKQLTVEIQKALEETVTLTQVGQQATEKVVQDTRLLEEDIVEITNIVQNAATQAYRIADLTQEQHNITKIFVYSMERIGLFSDNIVQDNQRIMQNLGQLNQAVNQLSTTNRASE